VIITGSSGRPLGHADTRREPRRSSSLRSPRRRLAWPRDRDSTGSRQSRVPAVKVARAHGNPHGRGRRDVDAWLVTRSPRCAHRRGRPRRQSALSPRRTVEDTLPQRFRCGTLVRSPKDLGRPETIFQLVAEGLASEFAPLRSLDNPNSPTIFPSRSIRSLPSSELAEVRSLVMDFAWSRHGAELSKTRRAASRGELSTGAARVSGSSSSHR